jgi:hypothetical protein
MCSYWITIGSVGNDLANNTAGVVKSDQSKLQRISVVLVYTLNEPDTLFI